MENRERKRHRSHILEALLIWAVIWCAVGMIVRDSCRDVFLMQISLEAPLRLLLSFLEWTTMKTTHGGGNDDVFLRSSSFGTRGYATIYVRNVEKCNQNKK